MCIICTGEIYKQNLILVKYLDVSYCLNLTSEKLQEILIQCKNLTSLCCYSCPSLTSLDFPSNKYLILLGCSSCASLTSLDIRNNKNLVSSDCSSCTSLTRLKGHHGYVDCSDCPWIYQNGNFPSNLQRLIKLQKWYRRILIIKYMKSKQFIEWIYNPNNVGGKCHKFKLSKEFA